jgi:hypothetical protein
MYCGLIFDPTSSFSASVQQRARQRARRAGRNKVGGKIKLPNWQISNSMQKEDHRESSSILARTLIAQPGSNPLSVSPL